ncbi:MAG: type II secretion system protein [Methyloprofundus sp.]|nr:type II secretion system protein [Methyloprofundus sp.]
MNNQQEKIVVQINEDHTKNKHMKNEDARRKQAGFTLVEFMIVLGLIAIATAGAFFGIPSVMKSIKTNTLTSAVVQVSAIINSSGNASGNYGTRALDEYIVRSDRVPQGLTVRGTSPNRTLHHAFGGSLETMGRENRFVVTLNNIPGDICLELFSSASSTRVNVSSSDPSSVPVDSGGYTAPYMQTDAVMACAENTPNRMHFIY